MTVENINLENAILYADSSRGVYIPQHFAETINRECVSGIPMADLRDLESDYLFESNQGIYWDTWNHVLDNATVTDPSTGIEYGLWQDGDLWLVPLADLAAIAAPSIYASDLEESV